MLAGGEGLARDGGGDEELLRAAEQPHLVRGLGLGVRLRGLGLRLRVRVRSG